MVLAASVLLRANKLRRVHWLFAGFSVDIGLWYLSQSLFGFGFQTPIWDRLRVALAVLVPVLAVNLFEAMLPSEEGRSRLGRVALLAAIPCLGLGLSRYVELWFVRVAIFIYAVAVVAAGLLALWSRGQASRSRATRRRVRFLVITGALAASFTIADFAWVIGDVPHFPPVGVVLSIVFMFMLAQALRHERLLDLYELLGRLVVATVVAFAIAGLFYVMVTVIGQFNTMWLNAILVAIVVLVLFNPLRNWVEKQIRRYLFLEGGRLAASMSRARRRLAHTLELDDMGEIVMDALERSRAVTDAALYLMLQDGSVFERLGSLGLKSPARVEVATATALLERLREGPVVMEELTREAKDAGQESAAGTVVTAAEVLGPLRRNGVVFGIFAEDGEQLALLVVADDRYDDAFSPEDIAGLEALTAQLGVVIENSRVYDKLKERDRLAVLGQMAAGLAHEIRNPLGAIKGAAQLLADPVDGAEDAPPAQQEFLGIILEEVDRLDTVVSSVLDLARQSPEGPTPVDVNGAVRRALQVMGAEWNDAALEVNSHLGEGAPRAVIDGDQLRQVLLNLLQNAAQAMKGQGTITVRTRARRRGEQTWVAISVEDEGPGISRAARQNIFLPFFTTKEKGTGLGLAICQRIVQGAGGRIEVRSREGEGTTFDVVLPAAAESFGTPTPAPVDRDVAE